MLRTSCATIVAALFLAACATQEAAKPAAPQPAPTPAPAPAPRAAPAPTQNVTPQPVPQAPVAQKARIAAQTLFDFDKATLRPDGKSTLDDIAAQSRDVKIESIIVTGHADRIGSEEYNRNLSARRANAVKAYLVSKGNDAARIYAEGKGKSQPVTGDKCRKMGAENRRNKKLIACLQPDRRVEIEVLGTRSR